MSVAVECSGERITQISLGIRRRGRDYTELDRKILAQAAQAVGRAHEEDDKHRLHDLRAPC